MSNTSSSGLDGEVYEVIPLNPLMQPVNADLVLPVYVIISSSIFKRPYESGNPSVPVGNLPRSILIVLSYALITVPNPTCDVRLVVSSIFTYLSIF